MSVQLIWRSTYKSSLDLVVYLKSLTKAWKPGMAWRIQLQVSNVLHQIGKYIC